MAMHLFCSDVGQHQMWAAQFYKFNKPRRWINSGGLGTMGVGIPYAMGVKKAFPNAKLFAQLPAKVLCKCVYKELIYLFAI
jgi:thiamine pyrophosphate-dependent acetolactate synthase large subunit-like protein